MKNLIKGKKSKRGEIVIGLLFLCMIAFSLLGVAVGDSRAKEQSQAKEMQDAQTIQQLKAEIKELKIAK